MKKKYSPETQNWIAAGQAQPYGSVVFPNGVRLLSAITDQDLAVTEKVAGTGYAEWRAVNENARVRKLHFTADFEEQRAFWSRQASSIQPVYQITIEKELEATGIRDVEYRESVFSENLGVGASGTETLLSKDILSGKFTKSKFRVEEAHRNERRVDVGIITIRDDELQAVLRRLKPRDRIPGKNRTYAATSIKAKSGQTYKIAIVQCTGEGEGSGQKTADDLIDDLNPLWILVVGIAGAIPSTEFTLGDVVAASRLHDFTVMAWRDGARATYQQGGGEMHPIVVDLLSSLKFRKDAFVRWNSDRSIGLTRPGIVADASSYQGDVEWKKEVQESVEYHRQQRRTRPVFRVSPVGSSDVLMRDPSHFQQWLESARHLEAVEMELGGIYRAARKIDREYPIIAVRGISDIVGLKRDDNWLQYACNSAAAFAIAILRSGIIRLDIR
jgi:nucleoside phosphorylase